MAATQSPTGQPRRGMSTKVVAFEDAIALTGDGRFHYMLLAGCGMCVITMVVSTINTSYLLPSASCDFNMTSEQKGLLGAIGYLGMICSSHLWGFLADTKGRRNVLVVGLAVDGLCYVAESFTHAYWLYLVFRFFNGFFICSCSNVVYAYLGEFHPARSRARAIMTLGAFVSVGSATLTGLAWLVLPQQWSLELPAMSFRSWRVFVMLCSLPGIITALYLSQALPESPKFLLSRGRAQESLQVLRNIYAVNTGNQPHSYPVTELTADMCEDSEGVRSAPDLGNSPLGIARSLWRQTSPLFGQPHLRNTLLACLMQFAFYATSISLTQWLPNIFNDLAGFHASRSRSPSDLCEAISGHGPRLQRLDTTGNNWTTHGVASALCPTSINPEMFVNSMIHGSVSGLFYFCGAFLINFVGKKRLLYGEIVLATGCGVGLYFTVSSSTVLALSCLFVALLFSCMGVLNSVVVDVFPTHLRAMSLSLSLMIGRVGCMLGSLMIGALLDTYCAGIFIILSGLVVVSGVLCIFLPSGTKPQPASSGSASSHAKTTFGCQQSC